MNYSVRYIIFCLFTLSAVFCRAESVKHNFQKLYTDKDITVTASNTIGTTSFCTYTCTNGAEFSADNTKTSGAICIFLDETNAQVETTLISGLDSLVIQYYPATEYKEMVVSIKEEGGEWTSATVVQKTKGTSVVKLPTAGDYYLRIKRKNAHFYIRELEYHYIDLSGCPNCFLYHP